MAKPNDTDWGIWRNWGKYENYPWVFLSNENASNAGPMVFLPERREESTDDERKWKSIIKPSSSTTDDRPVCYSSGSGTRCSCSHLCCVGFWSNHKNQLIKYVTVVSNGMEREARGTTLERGGMKEYKRWTRKKTEDFWLIYASDVVEFLADSWEKYRLGSLNFCCWNIILFSRSGIKDELLLDNVCFSVMGASTLIGNLHLLAFIT